MHAYYEYICRMSWLKNRCKYKLKHTIYVAEHGILFIRNNYYSVEGEFIEWNYIELERSQRAGDILRVTGSKCKEYLTIPLEIKVSGSFATKASASELPVFCNKVANACR